MAMLRYKTRGESDPQGLPKVYFCCHPSDFSKYFDTISDEILKRQNCAIWYIDGAATRDEDYFAALKQMNLFVMPVTSQLLLTENDALAIDFTFAIQNHIPVLPLAEEDDLEDKFNEKCGGLQLLHKNSTDDTVISYEEKFNRYLEAVLIGDELAERVRAAFDAYIFLSYRKKDRKFAQDLMRLIHKNEFCRDIAIWYDEFLIPGENFNDSIKKALEKSGLFVLAVTPNIVNEDNYIMAIEYPLAKQTGKEILPAELVPTDRAMLFAKYNDLPAPTDAYDDGALSEQLLASLQKIAIKENDTSAEHNFFVGLAYLDGIDVEIDYARAVALITSAAKEHLNAATKKLAEMYKTGKGVAIDYEESLIWQHQLVNDLKQKFLKEWTEESFLEYFNELLIFAGDLYGERGRAPYDLGASKIIEDCIRIIVKYERELLKNVKTIAQHKEVVAAHPILETMMEKKSFLRCIGADFLPKTWGLYRDLLFDKNDEITVGQAIIRYLLSYYSEYSLNMDECIQERKEFEEIIAQCAAASGESVDSIKQRIQKNITLESLIRIAQYR